MANNTVRHINIIGHQNPDTDSICSALAYAWLKNRGSLTGLYEARRAGHVNRETRFVLQHFGVEPPRLCTDVSPQIKDIDIRKQAGIDGEMSPRAADADYIIYIWSLGGKPETLADFTAKWELLSEFKAVKDGNVFCTTPDYFQITNTLGDMIVDMNTMLTGSDAPMEYLFKLQ